MWPPSRHLLSHIGVVRSMLPDGFALYPHFLDEAEEEQLLGFAKGVTFGHVTMRGVTSKRRVAQFGFHYSFETFRLTEAAPIAPELLPFRDRAAQMAGVEPEEFSEALVTEYPAGATIGWHRDAPPFGIVSGISLAASCRMRFQKGSGDQRQVAAVELPPRSMYLITGPARSEWQHTIPAVKATRYSITFRTLKKKR